MKYANVVSVQDFDTVTPASAPSRQSARVERMTTHLRRYPGINEEERSELLEFLTSGVPEEIVQVTLAPGLATRYAAFRKDHPQHFPSSLRVWLPTLSLLLIGIAGLMWRLVL